MSVFTRLLGMSRISASLYKKNIVPGFRTMKILKPYSTINNSNLFHHPVHSNHNRHGILHMCVESRITPLARITNIRKYTQIPKPKTDTDTDNKNNDNDNNNKLNDNDTYTNNRDRDNDNANNKKDMPKLAIGARLKYFLLRQNRPFNIDEFTAFFSWILMGNFLWILIGTTTFIGFIIYIVNWIGDGEVEKWVLKKLITFDNKLNVDLNDPKFKATWEDGNIKIRNLKVSSTFYELSISEVSLTFSFNKWFDGQGLIDGIAIDGLQGDINMIGDEALILDDSLSDNYELRYLNVKHSKINFHSETYFNKPLELVVFNCNLKKLRRRWMVYDFLNADSMFGSLGGSLFTLHRRQHRFAHFTGMDLHNEIDDSNNSKLNNIKNNKICNADDDKNDRSRDDIWKKITRLRIDMLDLSFLNNENSKLNWIESGKAEIIFDIMLPNEDDSLNNSNEFKFDFSINGIKEMRKTIYDKLKDSYDDDKNTKDTTIEENKYVVIDMKINYYNLTAKYPNKVPCSSLTGLPYITPQDLSSLVTFINDEKFGLSSKKSSKLSKGLDNEDGGSNISNANNSDFENDEFMGYSSNEINDEHNDIDNSDDIIGDSVNHKRFPPIKFRIIQNLNDFEYVDLPSLLSFTSMPVPEENADPKMITSFINTNKFIDSSIVEVLALLLVYKDEIQTRLIDVYSRRSGFEILFNNFILGNLILVGLGSFVI